MHQRIFRASGTAHRFLVRVEDFQAVSELAWNRRWPAPHTPGKHRIILMTACSAGLRVSEVVSLKLRHIDSARMLIFVEDGKGVKDRHTILSKKLLENLRNYWQSYRPTKWLFPSPDPEKHISRSTAQKLFANAKKKAGISRGRGIHTLRHCFATHLLEAGYDISTIQKLLGHRHLSSTLIYLHVSKKVISAVKSPLDSDDFADTSNVLTAF